MNSLNDYYGELTRREGKSKTKLVAPWPRDQISSITHCFRRAFTACRFEERPFTVEKNITGPALGNKLANHFATELCLRLKKFTIQSCAGQGYPDRRLVRVEGNRSFALELKATTAFEPKSNHRVILTSSSSKLRQEFSPPINHLLVTVFFRKICNQVWIYNMRLDFLGPSSKVNVRLEASVSQHLLADAKHPSRWQIEIN